MEEIKIPRHIAIIMDGNGRWARRAGMPRVMGHYRGAQVAEDIVRYCGDLGVEYLTLFTFSTENWRRPKEEVDFLFELLRDYLLRKREEFSRERVRLRFIGRRDRIEPGLRLLMEELERETSKDYRITVILAVDYGGRDDILRAVHKAMELKLDRLDERTFSHLLDLGDVPDPDLVIRTGGERRISNFLLWHIAYSELYFTEVCWPEFSREELLRAIRDFSTRKRKFGRVLDE